MRLRDVQIIWKPDQSDLPPVKLVQHQREDDSRYSASWGACNADFSDTSDEEQVNMLFRQFHQLTVIYGLAPQDVHETFMDIPEYRRALAEFGSISPDDVE
jgi:hypothetical protein